MKLFLVLLKREWWEWKNTIFWVAGIYTFILIMLLVPITKLSHNIDPSEVNFNFDNVETNWDDQNSSKFQHQFENWKFAEPGVKAVVVYGMSLVSGIQLLQVLLLFIGLFYFADSLYNERMNFSTLFIRSQPVSDHMVIGSKIAGGFLGIMGVSLVMSLVFLTFTNLTLWILGSDFGDLVFSITRKVKLFDLYTDMIIFQFVALIWLSPFILFLMWVSASVKKRPLIIGLGAPILAAISLFILFGNADMIKQLFLITNSIKEMLLEQFMVHPKWEALPAKVEIFNSFWGYLATPRTVVSIVLASGFYALSLFSYRKNIPVS
ncbi:MAG: hypothetical protein HQ510_01185 [Candidatus Marinimicrobia bacterium]|nr:hypothetical protein [Candidatus Neomarinimicrobiota bacterium]